MLHEQPAEFIISVSSLLNFRDKLNLIATCKKLNDIISKTNLYECLDLARYKGDHKPILQRFKREQYKGAQVKILCLCFSRLSSTLISQLYSVFPKVTRFIAYNDKQHGVSYRNPMSEPLATWIHTIEVYNTSTDWTAIWFALKDYTFPRLTELKISKMRFMHPRGEPCVLDSIKELPSLRKLNIVECSLTLGFLEKLHTNCKRIKSLTLDSCLLTVNDDSYPKSIMPANSVLYLNINYTFCFDKNGLLLDYIARKYPNLQRLNFNPSLFEEALVDVLQDIYPGSKGYLGANVYDEEYDYYGAMMWDIKIKEDDYRNMFAVFRCTLKSYYNSAQTFITSLPNTIKSLAVSRPVFTNIEEILSVSHLNLDTLRIPGASGFGIDASDFLNSLSHLKHLTSLKTLDISLEESIKVFNLQNVYSTSITKLVINTENVSFHIDSLLSAFPYLKDLCIKGIQPKLLSAHNETETQHKRIYPHLQKLTMERVEVERGVFDYIAVVAPNIKKLDLDIFVRVLFSAPNETYLYDFSGWKLEKCFFKISDDHRRLERYCKITWENAIAKFIFPYQGNTARSVEKDFNFMELKRAIISDIKFSYVGSLKVYGFPMKKSGDDIVLVGK